MLHTDNTPNFRVTLELAIDINMLSRLLPVHLILKFYSDPLSL